MLKSDAQVVKVDDAAVRPLSVARQDPERWLGVRAGTGTAANHGLAGIAALVITTVFFVGVHFAPTHHLRAMLLDRGPTQYVTVFLGVWSMVVLLVKRRKLKVQRRALDYACTPTNAQFVLTSQTADDVIARIHGLADDPPQFIVFNRILIALASLKNLGRVSDVDDLLRSIADRDESAHQTSFATLSGFLWAIPVLGFIGTVLGLAGAIGKFSGLLEQQSEVAGIVGSLKEVTGGLSTAFETTLLALVVALVVQLWMTSQRKAEEMFLDDCQDYCLRQIVSRIKILPFEQARDI